MDKVTCLAYILYQTTTSQEVKKNAIQLLNGDVTLREFNKNGILKPYLKEAESIYKKNLYDKNLVQQFANEFLLIEV